YADTISAHAAPSPSRHLLICSPPAPTVTAVATPTSLPFRTSLHGLARVRPAWVVNPLSNGHYDRLNGKVPAPPSRDSESRRAPPRLRVVRARLAPPL